VTPKTVQSVTGPVPVESLGTVLSHEHLFIDLTSHWQPTDGDDHLGGADAGFGWGSVGSLRRNPFGKVENLILDDLQATTEEVSKFRDLGGTTIVDLTPPDIGRDAVSLKAVAEATGLQIVCGSGHYIFLAHPPWIASADVGSLTDELLGELEVGIEGTGIRSGVIGEIGTSNPIHPDEDKVLRAAARAHRQANVPIVVHLSPPPRGGAWKGAEVLDILGSEGADLSHVLLAHMDNMLAPGPTFDRALADQRELLARGCYLGYDGFGKEHYFPSGNTTPYPSFWCPSDQIRAQAIALLSDRDFDDHLMLSHDVCFRFELTRFGGFGYSYLLRTVPKILSDYGIGMDQVNRWLVDNPARFFGPLA
jgi:phosphotriesterase-related protein